MNELLNSSIAMNWALVLLRLSLILGTAWGFHFLLQGRSPRWQISLWRSAVTLLLIISLASPWLSGWGFKMGGAPAGKLPVAPVLIAQEETASFSKIEDWTPKRSDSASNRQVSASAMQPKPSPQQTAALAVGPTSPVDVALRVMWGGYLFVVACHVLLLMTEAVRLRRFLKHCVPANQQWTQLVERIARQTGMKCIPDVVVSKEISGPMATGLLRPRIVIPAGLSGELTERQQEFVIAHECSHLLNHDLWWSMLIGVVRIGFWPHPLVWRLPATHRLVCDLRCDAAAAGQDPSDYGQCSRRWR